ncbi:hypothetical protein HAX54_032800, partial [Datura stramonium]|nr:hypothetical protein [Datura stramonium]
RCLEVFRVAFWWFLDCSVLVLFAGVNGGKEREGFQVIGEDFTWVGVRVNGGEGGARRVCAVGRREGRRGGKAAPEKEEGSAALCRCRATPGEEAVSGGVRSGEGDEGEEREGRGGE